MHKLLVPVDNSPCAMRALAHAIRLATEHGPMPLHIVHAHEEPDVAGKVQIYMTEEKASELLRRNSEQVLGPAIAAAQAAGVPFTTEILTGADVAMAISDCADRRGCDGIVMGTRGMGAIANLMMGSIATKVIHLATVPVTLVK